MQMLKGLIDHGIFLGCLGKAEGDSFGPDPLDQGNFGGDEHHVDKVGRMADLIKSMRGGVNRWRRWELGGKH